MVSEHTRQLYGSKSKGLKKKEGLMLFFSISAFTEAFYTRNLYGSKSMTSMEKEGLMHFSSSTFYRSRLYL